MDINIIENFIRKQKVAFEIFELSGNTYTVRKKLIL